MAKPSAAAVPKMPELLNVSLPESVRVTKTRCAEYFTLPQKLGRILRIKPRVLVQHGRKQKIAEKGVGGSPRD